MQAIENALSDMRAFLTQLIVARKALAERIVQGDREPDLLRAFSGLKDIEESTDRKIRRLEDAYAHKDKQAMVLGLLALPGDSRLFDYSGGFGPENHEGMKLTYDRAKVSVHLALESLRDESGRLP